MTDIILASSSPRRAELLDQLGIKYRVKAVDIDETPLANESPTDLVQRLSLEKSQAVSNSTIPVLGSDTLGLIEDNLLLKPLNYAHAKSMLQKLSGQWHEIFTAVTVTSAKKSITILNHNRVLFRQITDDEIQAYWNTGEPQDKAGGYAIQGIAACFIEKIEGSYSGIMGLPLFETSLLLKQFGISVLKRNN